MPDAIKQLRIERTAPRRRRRWIKPLLIGCAVLVLVSALAISQSQRATEVETSRVTQAWPAQAITVLNATGYVVADRKASVATKGTGRLEWLGVREGQEVKAGEVIARLENSELKAQVAQARANVEVAKAQVQKLEADRLDAGLSLKRQKELAAQHFVAASTIDTAQNRYQQSVAAIAAQIATVRMMQAAVDNAAAALDNTVIRAPFSGVILTKQANVGDVLAPFAASAESKGAVVTMADLATLEVEADVSETSLAKARVGQPCEIQLDALPDQRFAGTVARIVPTVDRSKATIKFKIRFDEKDPRILPDMSAKVAFLERRLKADERTPRLALNPAALQNGQAWVIASGVAQNRQVTTGAKLGDLLEVKSGLKAGELLVLKPDAKLKDGGKVVEKKP